MDLESDQNALYLQISQLEETPEVKNCLRNMVCSYADLCREYVVDIAGNHGKGFLETHIRTLLGI